MTPDELLAHFHVAADAARVAVDGLRGPARRARTERRGQYDVDLVADDQVLEALRPADVAVLSEESGRSGPAGAAVTVVVDPVDGSTNCARGIPYWAISLCALDGDGPLCALVRNQATGATTTAVRGDGAWRDGERLAASPVRDVGDAVVALSGIPARLLPWSQARALGSCALSLCDVAAGALDGFLDGGASRHGPWDYLGGLLACREAGAEVADLDGRDLVVVDPEARRRIVAAATSELLAQLRTAAGP